MLSSSSRYCGRIWSVVGARLSSGNDRSLFQTAATICRDDCDGGRRCWNCFIFCYLEGGSGVSESIDLVITAEKGTREISRLSYPFHCLNFQIY